MVTVALLAIPYTMVAQDVATSPPPDYVSRAEYDKLRAEHEAMKQELEALKTAVHAMANGTAPAAPAEGPAAKTAASEGDISWIDQVSACWLWHSRVHRAQW